MSTIRNELGKDYVNLPEILEPYQTALDDLDDNIKLKGKMLGTANREQPSLMSYYDQRKVELKRLIDFFEQEKKRVRSVQLKKMEQYPRELSDRAKEKYLDSDDEVCKVNEVALAIQEIYGQFESAVECFRQRGFALRNITELRAREIDDGLI